MHKNLKLISLLLNLFFKLMIRKYISLVLVTASLLCTQNSFGMKRPRARHINHQVAISPLGSFGLLPGELIIQIFENCEVISSWCNLKLVSKKALEIVTYCFGLTQIRALFPQILWMESERGLIPATGKIVMDDFFARTEKILNNHMQTISKRLLALERVHTKTMDNLLNFLPKSENAIQALSDIFFQLILWNQFQLRDDHPLNVLFKIQVGADLRDEVWTRLWAQAELQVKNQLKDQIESQDFVLIAGDSFDFIKQDKVKNLCKHVLSQAGPRNANEAIKLVIHHSNLLMQVNVLTMRSSPEALQMRDSLAKLLSEILTEEQALAILSGIVFPENSVNSFINTQLRLLRQHQRNTKRTTLS